MTMVRIDIEPVRGVGSQRYRVSWEGKTLIARARDPEHEAARILRELGITGLMQVFVCGRTSMVLDIETSAHFAVVEDSRGIRLTRWRAMDPNKLERLRHSPAGLQAQTAIRKASALYLAET